MKTISKYKNNAESTHSPKYSQPAQKLKEIGNWRWEENADRILKKKERETSNRER